MAKKPKVKMQARGAVAVLKSNGVRADIQRRVDTIAAHAGEGFTSKVTYGRNRTLGAVFAETAEAQRAEAKDRVLTRALDAGR